MITNVSNAWDWSEIARVSVSDGSLKLAFGPTAICFALITVGAIVFLRRSRWKKRFGLYEVVEAELNIANIGKIKLRPNDEIVRIAYQAWIELSTRKIGLAFDAEHDVITEIYSSWYETFARLRDLAKTIPAQHIQTSPDTRALVELMVRVLNDGLRPHLTAWQAKFRRWYESEAQKDDHANLSPQQIQRLFPDYKSLVEDLVKVQSQIVQYRDFLWRIAKGEKDNSQE